MTGYQLRLKPLLLLYCLVMSMKYLLCLLGSELGRSITPHRLPLHPFYVQPGLLLHLQPLMILFVQPGLLLHLISFSWKRVTSFTNLKLRPTQSVPRCRFCLFCGLCCPSFCPCLCSRACSFTCSLC